LRISWFNSHTHTHTHFYIYIKHTSLCRFVHNDFNVHWVHAGATEFAIIYVLLATYERDRENGGYLRGLIRHRAHVSRQGSIVGEIRRDVPLASGALRLVAVLEDAPRWIATRLRECDSSQQHCATMMKKKKIKDALSHLANRTAVLSILDDKEKHWSMISPQLSNLQLARKNLYEYGKVLAVKNSARNESDPSPG